MANHGNKSQPFRLALSRVDYCHVISPLKCAHYNAFQRHANFEVQKPSCVCVSSLPSIILALILRNSSLLQQVHNFMVSDWRISIRFFEFLCIKVPCLGTTRTKISACKPNEKLSHPSGSSWYLDPPPSIQTDPKLTCSGKLYIYWQHHNCLVNNRRRIFQKSQKKVNVIGN